MSAPQPPRQASGAEEPGSKRDLLAGRYRLLDPLGTGGTSSVYRAWDEHLSDFRAVKILDGAVAHNPRIRRRLLQEAEVMARLQHPNVVTLHHAGADGHQLYIVMELMLGGSMMERLHEDGPLPPRMAVQVMSGVLDALQLAHDHGIVHRDVKPHNILLDGRGTPKVTDFGIARWEDGGLTKTGAVLGTLAYMPPEQKLSARRVDLRSDIYAVGATLYALLTGRMPHDLYAADIDPTIARELFAGIASPLVPVIRRATAFRAPDRYASATAMQAALAAAVATLPPDPPTPPLVSPDRLGKARSQVRLGPTLLGTTASAENTTELVRLMATTERSSPAPPPPPVRRTRIGGILTLTAFVGIGALGALGWGFGATDDPTAPTAAAAAPASSAAPIVRPRLQRRFEPLLDTGVDPPEPPATQTRPSRIVSKSPPAVPSEPRVDPNEERAGRWQIAQWSTGRVQADVVAHLPADSAVIGPDGDSTTPNLVLRCSAKRPIAALRTGLDAVGASGAAVDVQVAGATVRQRVRMEPDPSLRGELLFPRPADWIGKVLDAKSPISFTFRPTGGTDTTVVFTVGDTTRVATALAGCR